MNTTSYEEKIKKIVDEILKEKNDNPRDSTFRFLQEYHSEAQHISLRFPGIFVKTLPTEVFTINNRNFRMDGAELVLPDDTIPCKSVLNPEQQTKPISTDKRHALYDYKLQITFRYKLPGLNLVVTNLGDGDHTVIYESHGDAFKVHVRVFTDEEISKRLSTLKDNIEIKKLLSEIEVLDFAYVMLFAQENKAKDYSKRVVELFSKVKYLDPSIQLDIHYVMKKLIRLHFRNDEKKTREMLTMITKAIHPELLDEIPTLNKAIEKAAKKDEIILQKEEMITQKEGIITQKEKMITQKEEMITQKENEIQKLKEKLKENDIEVD